MTPFKSSSSISKLKEFKAALPKGVNLVVVSKFRSSQEIMDLYRAGQRDFGENRAQELKVKIEELPNDIRWHFIGPLQTNKIKMFIERVHLIHSIDSERLLRAVDREAQKRNIVVDCLLQLHIAREESKQGLTRRELLSLVEQRESFHNIRVRGVMGMASFIDDKEVVSAEFASLKELYDTILELYPSIETNFNQLSMGMSGDWQLAVEQGSTMVRVGSAIF
ncbi:MAG: YggS family pyridoxal phosphate-dependent enzyme [Bacteroidales bacterium]